MPQDKPFLIYATHAWSEDDDYLRFYDYLGDIENFYYVNQSRPGAQPDGGDPLAVREELQKQIESAEIVVVLATQHSHAPELIELQVATAKRLGKPVLVVEPFGPEEVPEALRAQADKVIEWYARKLVDAIKLLARGEDTNRFEVLDWPGEL